MGVLTKWYPHLRYLTVVALSVVQIIVVGILTSRITSKSCGMVVVSISDRGSNVSKRDYSDSRCHSDDECSYKHKNISIIWTITCLLSLQYFYGQQSRY